jgi:hypothetical protein
LWQTWASRHVKVLIPRTMGSGSNGLGEFDAANGAHIMVILR